MIGLLVGFVCGVIATVMVFIVIPSTLFILLTLMLKARTRDE